MFIAIFKQITIANGMGLINYLKKTAKKNPFTAKNIQGVFKLVNDPKLSQTYYPEARRKSRFEILQDNFLWLAKHKEVNKYYYLYGLDKKTRDNEMEIIPDREFKIISKKKNIHPDITTINKEGYNYVCILRDKFVFSQFLSSLQFPAPKNLALLSAEDVTWLSDMKTAPLASLVEDPQLDIQGFCKKLSGLLGEGAFTLKIEKSKLYVKEKEITLNELKEKLTGMYLLQERIIQHPKLASLHPGSVNTIRLNTFNDNGKIEVFSAAFRMGAKGSSVDNWSAGGILAGIDLETGKLRKEGFFKPGFGGRVEKHPDTNITFSGFEIPFFKESIQLACNLHRYLYGIHSVGWDLAITENGPIFVEGNDDWDGVVPMALEKNFRSRFMKHYT